MSIIYANLVPLRETSSESVPALELYNMHKSKIEKLRFAIAYIKIKTLLLQEPEIEVSTLFSQRCFILFIY